MRILVVKLSSLGDLFHALPAVHCLKSGLNASIDWLVQPPYVELARCFTDVDRVITFHRTAFFQKLPDFLRELRSTNYDLIVDFQGLWKSAVSARLARGARRIGPSFRRERTRWLYSAVAGKTDWSRHTVDTALDIPRFLKVPILNPVFPVAFPAQTVEAPRPRVALVPFSRWPSKNWPALSFVNVSKELRERAKASIFLLGGPEEVKACSVMEQQIPAANLAGKLSLPELGGFLKEMDLIITNDSGPMHMAAAAGSPTLAIFGSTDPARTRPYGSNHRILKAGLKCQPCLSRICRFGDNSCLAALTPETVSKAALEMLADFRVSWPKGGRSKKTRKKRQTRKRTGPAPGAG